MEFLVEVQVEVQLEALVENKKEFQEEAEMLSDQCRSSKKLPVLIQILLVLNEVSWKPQAVFPDQDLQNPVTK